MAITATTLSSAIGASDTTIQVASATGITAPNFTTGSSIVYLFCETEAMLVVGITSTFVSVQRGVLGTSAAAHGASAPIISGIPSDFAAFAPAVKSQIDAEPLSFQGWSAPVTMANTITATGRYFHTTGTTILKTITAPTGYVEGGVINIVFDGSGAGLTWDATGNIAVAGTATTAASMVSFVFDSGSAKWHPSRLA
jgi:hypothetical protein